MSKEMTPREIWDSLTGRMQERLEMFYHETRARKIDHRSDKAMLQFNLIKIVKPPYSAPHYVDFAVITELGCRVYEIGQMDKSLETELDTLRAELAAANKRLAEIAELAGQRGLINSREVMLKAFEQIEAVARGE